MEKNTLRIHDTKLYQQLAKINERHAEKFRAHQKVGGAMQYAGPDAAEFIEMFDTLYDQIISILMFHGVAVMAIKILSDKLNDNYIGTTGRHLTQAQYEKLRDVVKGLTIASKMHTDVIPSDFDPNEIYKYLQV